MGSQRKHIGVMFPVMSSWQIPETLSSQLPIQLPTSPVSYVSQWDLVITFIVSKIQKSLTVPKSNFSAQNSQKSDFPGAGSYPGCQETCIQPWVSSLLSFLGLTPDSSLLLVWKWRGSGDAHVIGFLPIRSSGLNSQLPLQSQLLSCCMHLGNNPIKSSRSLSLLSPMFSLSQISNFKV